MTETPNPRRRRRRRALLAALGAVIASLAAAGVANAAVSGTVVNLGGVPLPGVSINATEQDGSFVGFATTDGNGNYVITTDEFDIAPYSIKASTSDSCDTSGTSSTREATIGPIPDGAVGQNFSLDVKSFCTGFKPDSALPDASGLIDPATASIRSFPGAVNYINVSPSAGFSVTNLQVTLADGTPIGGSADSTNLAIQSPTADYDGPINLTFTKDGVPFVHAIGTLTVRKPVAIPLPGPIDIEAIVDVSGSMGSTDPSFVRKDAVSLLLDLANRGDRVGAVGFDDAFKPIFDSTVISGPAVVNRLKAAARRRIVNAGGTDYNDGFDAANAALTSPGVDPTRQKGIIFLTDGANGSTYENGHLRFAFNASGRTWPVCVVQLGSPSSFQANDVALLKRIARETGGQYLATQNAGQLTDLYFRCFGRTTGQQTLKTQTFTFTAVGQQRTLTQSLSRGNKSATFFASWRNGNYTLELTDPRGKKHTARAPGRGFTYRGGRTFGFFKVTNPIAGRWKLKVVVRRLTAPRDSTRTIVTIPPRVRR